MKPEQMPLRLRPHHILDIVRNFGHDLAFKPHPYEHDVHRIAGIILKDLNTRIQLVVDSDDICIPCVHLQADGCCKDVLQQLDPAPSKQLYNDALDIELLKVFNLKGNIIMTMEAYLHVVQRHIPGLEAICSHPGEDPNFRLEGLTKGLRKMGIKPSLGIK